MKTTTHDHSRTTSTPRSRRTGWSIAISAALLLGVGATSGEARAAKPPPSSPEATVLVTGLASGSGSTIGPDGALYVTEGATGSVLRVDPSSGAVTTFATGLPTRVLPIGGAMDVVFVGRTAYVLVTLVGPDVGGSNVVGIYRVDGPSSSTLIADIGAYSIANPPATAYFIPSGVQYAIETFRGGFLVTDGHHNRVLQVTLDGRIYEFRTFGNIVPTGLEIEGNNVYMAQAGPVPHLPASGKIVSLGKTATSGAEVVASGARLLVDVESGRGATLYGLSQGVFPVGNPEGSPAAPNTGSLVQVNRDGTFTVLVSGLNQPTSLELIGNTAYVVTLGGEIWRIDNVSTPPFGTSR